MQSLTLQTIFRRAFRRFAATRKLPAYMRQAAERIIACRTAALGGHVQSCPNGHVHRVHYNSCKHRSCPQCAFLQVERWLARQRERLLDCPHFHLIFTVPSELNPYWRYNKRLFARLLFRAVHDTLVELLGDARYLGAVARMLAALHTWSQQLADHPHVHVLVTAGGLSVAEAWRQPLKSCLIPRRVVMQLNSRLVAYRDGQVSFRYRDNREADAASGRGRSKVMTLAAPDFMRRVLEHVPPPGMHTVWSWGL